MKISRALFAATAMLATMERTDAMSARQETDAATLRVTGRDLVLNGVGEIPRGLFSVHAAPLTPERVEEWGVEGVRLIHTAPDGVPGSAPAPFVLDCFYDRYQPALALTRPDWEEHLRGLARRHGAAMLASIPGTRTVEFWNEPYLNWATKPGVNYDGRHYNLAEAAPAAPVVGRLDGVASTNLLWDAQRIVALRWDAAEPPTQEALTRLEREGQVDYLATRFMPQAVRRGETFRWRDGGYVAGQRWWVRDRGQPFWWSGKANLDLYLRMAVPFAQELKAANPDAPLVVGWGFHIFESNWRAWDILHRPTLDALHAWVDGYGEHHYGVDPRRVAASYEIADAYMRAHWNKRIGFWNTEAGGMQDPERPDVLRPPPDDDTIGQARGAAAYFLRDVLTMLRHVPDKARMRCSHEPQVNSGVPAAFRLLKPLRGTLVETLGPDDGVWTVAARAPGRLTIACYNGSSGIRRETLAVEAPRGTELAGATRRFLVVRDDALDVAEETEEARGRRWQGRVELEPGSAQVLVFALDGAADPDTVRMEQYVGDGILHEVAAGKPAEFRVTVPADVLAATRYARVRWVIAGANAPLRVRCNGRLLTPATQGSGPFRDVVVDAGWLAPETVLTFEAEGWESTVVGTASLLLSSDLQNCIDMLKSK